MENTRLLNDRYRDYGESLSMRERTKRELVAKLKNLYSRVDNTVVMFSDDPRFPEQLDKLSSEVSAAEYSLYEVLREGISEDYQGDD